MYSSSHICFDGCTTEQLSSFQPDPMLSNSDESGASVTSYKDCENIKMPSKNAHYSSCDAGSSFTCSGQLELNGSRDSEHFSIRRHQGSPASSSCHHDWNLNSDHQAKRARVENIIKCMTSSPGVHSSTDVMINQHEESGGMQENQRIAELPLHQEKHVFDTVSQSQMTRKQLESQHQHLRQLRTRFNHVDRVTDTVDIRNKERYPNWNNAPETSWDSRTDSYNESKSGSRGKYHGLKKVKLMNNFQSKPERIKLMADVLKYELSRVVTKSVDSIFKSMPLLQVLPNDEGNIETDMSLQSSVCSVNNVKPSCGNAERQVPDVRTDVLSLVVQKPRLERGDMFNLQSRSRGHHPPKPPTSFSYDSTLHEGERSEKNHNSAHHHALRCLQDGCSEVGQAKFETFDTHWNSVKVRSKVNSRSARSPHPRTVSGDPMLLQNLSLPHVKVESDNLAKTNMYILNEGLTTNHLKKAKLMFFYTRYPSSLVLRRCFHDVQFTRCITSQLIKWFSNFREFYYIQMEKFARHAVLEGVTDARRLTVGRESELFRALNMHYNKANDFQVPDRFLEIAEITLREFYIAISVGKDRDPSWKKAIYKVICKLDSDVPAEFKNHLSG